MTSFQKVFIEHHICKSLYTLVVENRLLTVRHLLPRSIFWLCYSQHELLN